MVKIGSARMDENGNSTGGKAGDQTGKEISKQDYYVHSKGWRVLRCVDEEKANKIAYAMNFACGCKLIGYDQSQRKTLYNAIKNYNFDIEKLDKKVETDCSDLVRVCVAYAYGKDLIPEKTNLYTGNMVSLFLKTEMFIELTGTKYTKSSNYLKKGDILVTKTKGHTVVVLTDGIKSIPVDTSGDYVKATGNVNIRVLPNVQAKIINVLRKGELAKYENEISADGWYKVSYEGDTGWVTNKYSELVEADKSEKTIIADISQYNRTVYWARLAKECALLILRASVGTKIDGKFKEYALKSENYEIPWGCFHYLKALSVAEAKNEASIFLKYTENFKPLFYAIDAEYSKIKKTKAREIVDSFLNEIRSNRQNCRVGIYIGHHLYERWNCDYKAFDFVWIPRYGKNTGEYNPKYEPEYPCDLHQYTSRGKISGIAGEIDLNREMYKGALNKIMGENS